MDEIIAQPAFDRRRGDGSFVSLLFVVAVPLAIAVVALTRAFIAPADTVLDLVPKNAVAYVHASGRHAVTAMLASSIDMPTGVMPDEVARFAAPGDDGLRHAILLAWRAPHEPTETEIATIRERGGLMIDERRAVLGDTALGLSVKVTSVIDASVADDPRRSALLARMRSLHAVQGFASAAVIPMDVLAIAEDANGAPLPAVVFGATVRDGRVIARVLPIDADASPTVGSPLAANAPLRDLDAPVTASEPSPSFDLLNVLFARTDADHPSPEAVDAAGQELRDLLDAPYVMWIRPDQAGATHLFRFPTVRPEDAKSRMAAYAAALEPSRNVITMPDGDIAVEFSVMPVPVSSGIAAFGSTDGIGTIYVGSDGLGGTLLGSSATMFAAHATAPRLSIDAFCTAPSILLLDNRFGGPAGLEAAHEALRRYDLKVLAVGKTVDNELRLCGYKLPTVDK